MGLNFEDIYFFEQKKNLHIELLTIEQIAFNGNSIFFAGGVLTKFG